MCRRKGNYFFGIEGYRIIGNPLPIFLKRVILKGQSMDIERFSDMIKPMTTWERGSLDQFLQLGSNNFPKELDGGLRRGQAKKKVRWDPGSDLQKLDNWEQKVQKGEEKDREKKEGEEEEEEEDEEANATEEEYSDDSYTQHEYLDDDDEDDFNVDDGGDDDEGILLSFDSCFLSSSERSAEVL